MKLVIDTDTGSDDAVALMLALGNPKVSVELITTVAGNVPLNLATENALATVALMGSKVPVYSGMAKPITRELHTAQNVHGPDGMSGAQIPRTHLKVDGTDGVTQLIEISKKFPGELTLVTLGPLTNIAAALLQDPQMLHRFKDVYMMAGSPEGWGNVTPSAEFNVWCDPESFKIVLNSGKRLIMVGWNISRDAAVIGAEEEAKIRAIGTARAAYVIDINETLAIFCRDITNLPGFDLPDPITVAIAIAPEMIRKSEFVSMDVSCSEEMRGTLIIDRRHTAPAPNVDVVWEADRDMFLNSLYEVCKDSSNPANYIPAQRSGK